MRMRIVGVAVLVLGAGVFTLRWLGAEGAAARQRVEASLVWAPPAEKMARTKLVSVGSAEQPVGVVAVPGEKSGRLYVIDKTGRVRVLQDGVLQKEPFVDLSGRISLERRDNGEQGLLGLAFHPQFLKNGRFYVNFTDRAGDTQVVEMRGERAAGRAERVMIQVKQPFANHNGGHLEFGPDGKLYILLGDGGSGGDPKGNAQNPKTLLGKMFRLDVDAGAPRPEVLGQGLRNPWRFTFDSETGDLYVADVGQNLWEWVHVVPAAGISTFRNFGWAITEGSHCFQKGCDKAGLETPAIEYSHQEGCSITGGVVYRGRALPELRGRYFFSDYCTGLLRSFRWREGKATELRDWKTTLDPDSKLSRIAAFGADQDGEMYVVSHDGPIYKLVPR